MSIVCVARSIRARANPSCTHAAVQATCFRTAVNPSNQKRAAGPAAMFSSVRIRLTLWYTAALACVLAVLALATYFIVRNNLRHRTDSAIAELADSFLTTVHAELRGAAESDSIGNAMQAAISEHRF